MNIAVIKNRLIENVIVVELGTDLKTLLPTADEFIEVTEESGVPILGLKVQDGKFQPFPSWLFDKSLGEWVAPAPKPEGEFYWDEPTLSWVNLESEPEVTDGNA